jgi:hypothetical protein
MFTNPATQQSPGRPVEMTVPEPDRVERRPWLASGRLRDPLPVRFSTTRCRQPVPEGFGDRLRLPRCFSDAALSRCRTAGVNGFV